MKEQQAIVVGGFVSGLAQASLFNPWDRALFLSIRDERAFLTRANFTKPWQGFSQSVIHRTIQGGSYFVLQAEVSECLLRFCPHLEDQEFHFLVGFVAGLGNGVLLSSLSVIKYYTWGATHRTFSSSIKSMYTRGGVSTFFRGAIVTTLRDMLFGCVYEVTRRSLSKDGSAISQYPFLCNVASASLSTIVSAPLNYARVMKFAAPPNECPPGIWKTVKVLFQQAAQEKTLTDGCKLLQNKLRIGWGTLRVGVGMGFGQLVFDVVKANAQEHKS